MPPPGAVGIRGEVGTFGRSVLPDWVRYAQRTTEQLAKQLGIPARKVLEALGRAADREIVHVGSAGILIPTRLGPLPRHMLRNFAPRLRQAHDRLRPRHDRAYCGGFGRAFRSLGIGPGSVQSVGSRSSTRVVKSMSVFRAAARRSPCPESLSSRIDWISLREACGLSVADEAETLDGVVVVVPVAGVGARRGSE